MGSILVNCNNNHHINHQNHFYLDNNRSLNHYSQNIENLNQNSRNKICQKKVTPTSNFASKQAKEFTQNLNETFKDDPIAHFNAI